MLTADDLSRMRTSLNLSLPGTAVFSRSTQSNDGLGGKTDAWANVGTVACRLSPSGEGEEQITGARFGGIAPYTLTIPYGSTFTKADRAVTGGKTFEIIAISEPRDYSLCVRLGVRLVD